MRLLALSALVLTPTLALAELRLGTYFTDHTVLQQGRRVPVWGFAPQGTEVEVAFGEQRVRARSEADGRWRATLSPLEASREGRPLMVRAGEEVITLRDVVVGEVWICSGQSNMEWPLHLTEKGAEEAAQANYPLIRHLKIERQQAPTPQALAQTSGWTPASPTTAPHFSAVGYSFAKELHTRLEVPIGLVNVTWGGSAGEAWLPPEALATTETLRALRDRWEQGAPERLLMEQDFAEALAAWSVKAEAARQAGKPEPEKPVPPGTIAYPHAPASCFNGMVNPLLPFAARGVLWYQGESNVGREREYFGILQALITSWRRQLESAEAPFYVVQLAGFGDGKPQGTAWARLREAQAKVLDLAHTGLAVALDLGDLKDIHPRKKAEVGRRLALLARAGVYGHRVDDSGPVFATALREGAAFRLTFQHTAGALTARGKPLSGFELAGADRVFHPAQALIQRDTVVVSSPKVKEPVAIRYGFRNYTDANLYNGAGLPALPFRTDDWE